MWKEEIVVYVYVKALPPHFNRTEVNPKKSQFLSLALPSQISLRKSLHKHLKYIYFRNVVSKLNSLRTEESDRERERGRKYRRRVCESEKSWEKRERETLYLGGGGRSIVLFPDFAR
jgi:hypothetical protein